MEAELIREFLSDGSGSGSGSGYGYGYGYGFGDGYGYGFGDGYGDDDSELFGFVCIYGDGSGEGRGRASGSGHPNGDGRGQASGSGEIGGKGYCFSSLTHLKAINGRAIYDIDGVPTAITHIHGGIAKGEILRDDLTLVPSAEGAKSILEVPVWKLN